ncbi:anti-sigma factor RsbA family regulatory protein [Nonomuraea sp. NBC_01738]|uniref:anti-sigma factor RsbA family regulatory protein n=1 Tax=Nonomuraea sp. NBC_01738 TaxID=2976003 RepID=UPI002E11549E|nr:anti-sigma factor RsbA family regulatory protein [Nonomuraea sp. NBC_01738]
MLADPFAHPALFYRGDRDYVAATTAFVAEGLDRGEPVAVAVPAAGLALIAERLGAAAEKISLIDMSEAGRNPGRIIPAVLSEFADRHEGERVRIIGEPMWAGRSALEYPACAQHEALINRAFSGRPVTILCPYNAMTLAPEVLGEAERTHPVLRDSGGERPSAAYSPDQVVSLHNTPFGEPPAHVALRFDSANLGEARNLAADQGAAHGFTGARLDDIRLVLAELGANSLDHGGGSGLVRIWAEDGRLVFEVTDRGHITDPLVGRRPVDPRTAGSRGLLIVNLLSDLVRVHTRVGATVVRAYFDLP